MIKIIKKNLLSVIWISITTILSILLVKYLNILSIIIIKDTFLINLLLIFISISVAIITLLFSTVNKIREVLITIEFLEDDQINEIDKNIKEIFEEMKQDTIFLFYSLIIVFTIILFKEVNLPLSNINIITKNEFLVIMKFDILLLSLLSMYDILYSLLNIITVKNQMLFNEDNY